jgi:putative serine/threonine protein kinase
MEAEGGFLRVANGVSVGPRLLGVSREVLAMELVEGSYLVDWVGGLGPGDVGRLRGVLLDLMEQARRLDVAGLDHGELSSARRHVIVSGGVARIVDFESASVSRRCSNVTSMAQYLFFNRGMAGGVRGVIPLPDRDGLVAALSAYRRRPGEESFRRVLAASGLME